MAPILRPGDMHFTPILKMAGLGGLDRSRVCLFYLKDGNKQVRKLYLVT